MADLDGEEGGGVKPRNRGWSRVRILPYGSRVGRWEEHYGRYRGHGPMCEYITFEAVKSRARQQGRREIQEQRIDNEKG